ncbi:hypothetical protein [Aeromicrobium sp. CTD01-1L150]|uniref:hypothetical protein n=1 Tax=Aeromicrobium sp. CTD01-1L150 TaxID=3341830 RepID=UPI0035C1049A
MVENFQDYQDLHGVDSSGIRDAAEDPRQNAAALQSLAEELGRDEAAVERLDDAAESVASTFEEGPTDANVKQLVLAGHIPFALATLWPQLTFTDRERERALANGAETSARAMLNDLIAAGLVDEHEVEEDDRYFQWLLNAARRDVDYRTLTEIIRDHDVDPSSFDVLEDMEEFIDPDGKSFFLLPDDISGEDARHAVIMTYILNAGTDYGTADEGHRTDNDFEETPYSSAEVQRIIERQGANGWSYSMDVGFVHGNGGRMVTTPNAIMMGLGGNWLQGRFSAQGGTAWGDIFMVNIDNPDDERQMLQDIVESGVRPYSDSDHGPGRPGDDGDRDLDRLLHHEERHSQQWAALGYSRFLEQYILAAAWEKLGGTNWFEEDAGLADGGYE